MTKFEIGKKYYSTSIGDADFDFIWIVTGRTDKTVELRQVIGSYQPKLQDAKKFRISIYEDVEKCSPLGKYSMSPTLRANHEEVA